MAGSPAPQTLAAVGLAKCALPAKSTPELAAAKSSCRSAAHSASAATPTDAPVMYASRSAAAVGNVAASSAESVEAVAPRVRHPAVKAAGAANLAEAPSSAKQADTAATHVGHAGATAKAASKAEPAASSAKLATHASRAVVNVAGIATPADASSLAKQAGAAAMHVRHAAVEPGGLRTAADASSTAKQADAATTNVGHSVVAAATTTHAGSPAVKVAGVATLTDASAPAEQACAAATHVGHAGATAKVALKGETSSAMRAGAVATHVNDAATAAGSVVTAKVGATVVHQPKSSTKTVASIPARPSASPPKATGMAPAKGAQGSQSTLSPAPANVLPLEVASVLGATAAPPLSESQHFVQTNISAHAAGHLAAQESSVRGSVWPSSAGKPHPPPPTDTVLVGGLPPGAHAPTESVSGRQQPKGESHPIIAVGGECHASRPAIAVVPSGGHSGAHAPTAAIGPRGDNSEACAPSSLGTEVKSDSAHLTSSEYCSQQNRQKDVLQAIFKKIDRNRDGFMGRPELGFLMRSMDPSMPKHIIDKLLAELDTDQRGVIDFSEFVEWLARSTTEGKPERRSRDAEMSGLRAAFATMDDNRNGLIERKEFTALMRRVCPRVPEKDLDMVFKEMDGSRDGLISYDEFVEWLFSK
eukprot:TRINITY_DN13254_c0_g1_i4.p1 TRINITY_DN13254_c0_g1~~TRINITY_DN13254_c0_g1_i4.p1  ORF type:complete len:670 (-),score=125.88 TRINITY_DN13254_c0_g1_i4:50-1987(-)